MVVSKRIKPIHPGEHLAEILEELGISQCRLAKDICVPARRINEIIHGRRAISVDAAMRLARYFGTDVKSWINLQANYDLETAHLRLAARIEREVSPRAA